MKHNKRVFLLILSLTLVFSIIFTAVASARNVSGASVGDDEIDRGVAWEMLNNEYYTAYSLLNIPGSDYTDNYNTALMSYCDHAKLLLDSTTSTTDEFKEMYNDLNYLIGEEKNPANHARFGCYTVAFTNNGGWSDPIYLYNWSDDGGELSAWPGDAMRGGYTNEFGQKQYYALVPMDVPNIVFSSPQLDAANGNVPCVEVQTVDILVLGNTGYYLSGERDGAKYKVNEWELKDPVYKTFDDPVPTDPPTPKPTEQPTQEPTVMPTEPATEKPTVKADPVTEPSTEFDIDDYIPSYGGMLEFYVHSIENLAQEDLREMIVDATQMLAPGNYLTPEHIEKVSRVRNFAVTVYNDDRSSDNELIGARKMLQAAFENKSYEEIVDIMYQWFNMPDIETPDPTSPHSPTETEQNSSNSHMIGDADGDGMISIFDATRIQRVLAGYESENRSVAETNACLSGGSLSILDATAIQRYLVGYDDHYDIGAYIIPTGLKRS